MRRLLRPRTRAYRGLLGSALRAFPPSSEDLRQLEAFAEEMPTPLLYFGISMARAYLSLESGDGPGAVAEIREALTHGRAHGYMSTPPFWLPKVVARLCALALEHGIETGYVSRLVRQRRLAAPPAAGEIWPWWLKVYTLGRFSLLVDGQPQAPAKKAQKRALNLIKAVVALGGREVASEKLADLLWPDAEGSAARAAFDMTLHRLRKLLGREDAVLVRDGTVTLNPECCWVDAWCLERTLNEIERTVKDRGVIPAERLESLADKSLRLYQGDFLDRESEQPWLFPMREKLKRKFNRDLALVGRHWEAASAYYRCRDLLARVLGRAPSDETQAMWRNISQ
jgi:LuxR family maltose regulon positive regulatory protein